MKEKISIPKAQIIHNSTAGNAEHKKADLIKKVEQVADHVDYLSTDNSSWEKFSENKPDVLFLGGGDGTVHKLAGVLVNEKKEQQHLPICLLPLGTANNIAKTLGLPPDMELISQTSYQETVKFDIGRVTSLDAEHFFLEAAGFGIFPKLVEEMENKEDEIDSPSEELVNSMKTLLKVISEYQAKSAEIQVDDETITGKFLLAEIMNIKYIGPNFEIASQAEVGDGYLDLVLVREESREKLYNYVKDLVDNKKPAYSFSSFAETHRLKHLKMTWKGKDVHVDDEPLSNYSGEDFEVRIEPDALRFISKR
jgi:diacylglycerol kinase (ATP)